MYVEPEIIKAVVSIDDRGVVTHCNEFQLAGVRRFYTVANHRQGFVRAWHGHKEHDTFLWPIVGTWMPVFVSMEMPLVKAEPRGYTIDHSSILHIPAGWYHGHKNLTADAVLGVFSTATIEQAMEDDYRLAWDCWSHVWEEKQR